MANINGLFQHKNSTLVPFGGNPQYLSEKAQENSNGTDIKPESSMENAWPESSIFGTHQGYEGKVNPLIHQQLTQLDKKMEQQLREIKQILIHQDLEHNKQLIQQGLEHNKQLTQQSLEHTKVVNTLLTQQNVLQNQIAQLERKITGDGNRKILEYKAYNDLLGAPMSEIGPTSNDRLKASTESDEGCWEGTTLYTSTTESSEVGESLEDRSIANPEEFIFMQEQQKHTDAERIVQHFITYLKESQECEKINWTAKDVRKAKEGMKVKLSTDKLTKGGMESVRHFNEWIEDVEAHCLYDPMKVLMVKLAAEKSILQAIGLGDGGQVRKITWVELKDRLRNLIPEIDPQQVTQAIMERQMAPTDNILAFAASLRVEYEELLRGTGVTEIDPGWNTILASSIVAKMTWKARQAYKSRLIANPKTTIKAMAKSFNVNPEFKRSLFIHTSIPVGVPGVCPKGIPPKTNTTSQSVAAPSTAPISNPNETRGYKIKTDTNRNSPEANTFQYQRTTKNQRISTSNLPEQHRKLGCDVTWEPKQVRCRHYDQGWCWFGEECWYKHDELEVDEAHDTIAGSMDDSGLMKVR